ncbi:type II toxin-antitoxin system RelE/ParE family toxin [Bradyrhizobium sp. CB1717]|uniref:type II toxin-antitoxin system RelE/ParE family toxin n=1 Tax=Bradyrhizobium sp. CB1717 TaxID=3039154 RepID=UPI0024B2738E|nr:type II toxin-antitoxin system RelE/ParE family toxin [Bradyrhizobium sp. CB1717]WFU21924.1 type II toxin-antitoxin system RelE/ParE family toxin [Bradyrhizobium sp. CB1717]
MIKSFKHKALAELFEKGTAAKIDAKMHKRILVRLDVLDSATTPQDMDRPGYDFHPLRGLPRRYSVHVNGPWCLTFEFEGTDAYRVDFEQYH